jgi:hypothetical protein
MLTPLYPNDDIPQWDPEAPCACGTCPDCTRCYYCGAPGIHRWDDWYCAPCLAGVVATEAAGVDDTTHPEFLDELLKATAALAAERNA